MTAPPAQEKTTCRHQISCLTAYLAKGLAFRGTSLKRGSDADPTLRRRAEKAQSVSRCYLGHRNHGLHPLTRLSCSRDKTRFAAELDSVRKSPLDYLPRSLTRPLPHGCRFSTPRLDQHGLRPQSTPFSASAEGRSCWGRSRKATSNSALPRNSSQQERATPVRGLESSDRSK